MGSTQGMMHQTMTPPAHGPVTMYTSAAIQALHDSIAHENDPADKLALAKALQIVLAVQQKNSQQQPQGGGPAQALGAQLGG